MIYYNKLINKTKNDYSITLKNLNIKNKKLIDPNIKNELSSSVKFTNKNPSNKDYKQNLLKFSNKKQMVILLKGLTIFNNNLNSFISKWSGNTKDLFRSILNSKKDKTRNKNLLPLSKTEIKNKNTKIFPYMFGDNNLTFSALPLNRQNKNFKSHINSVLDLKILKISKNKNIKKWNSVNDIKFNKNVTKIKLNPQILQAEFLKNKNLKKNNLKKRTVNQIGSVVSLIKNKLISNYKPKKMTLYEKFTDYKYLIQLNKTNNYRPINTIRKHINNITIFNSKSAYSFSKNYNYKFNTSMTFNNLLTKNLYTFLESSFFSMAYLISKPAFIITPDKVVIHLFAFKLWMLNDNINKDIIKNTILKVKPPILKSTKNIIKLKIISQLLARYFKKPVEFDIVNLRYPYYNSDIFVKLLGLLINNTKLRIIKTKFFSGANFINPTTLLNKKNSIIPSYVSGIKIRVAGRLLTQRVIPRKTVKIITSGKLARGKVIYLETARFTNKNKRGAFSITVSTGHINL